MFWFRCFFILPACLFALDQEPWFKDVWEFNFTPAYTYSTYPRVHNGIPQHQHPSKDQFLRLDLSVSPNEYWQVGSQVELAKTPKEQGFRSAAFQLRRLWLNDLMGDSLSLTTGASIRGVSHQSLNDVSTPYHSNFNFEINTAAGIDWDINSPLEFRTFVTAALGMANRGYPWVEAMAAVETEWRQTHRFRVCARGAAGLGDQTNVSINHFHGYAFIKHRSIDLGIHYGYRFDIWGELTFAYARRLYARSFPEKANFFTISYTFPFSIL